MNKTACFYLLALISFVSSVFAQDTPMRNEFSMSTAAANNVSGQGIQVQRAIANRCSVRADSLEFSVTHVAVDNGTEQILTYNGTSNGTPFQNHYRRVVCLYVPPSGSAAIPLQHILNTCPSRRMMAHP